MSWEDQAKENEAEIVKLKREKVALKEYRRRKLDAAIDDLLYALSDTDKDNREFYIQNAIRFIKEARDE